MRELVGHTNEEIIFLNKISVINKKEEDLKNIELALKEITGGNYGKCLECHKSIAPNRLRATPECVKCIDCKTTDERSVLIAS